MEWQTAEAKNKFSELLDRAETEGPQHVTRRKKRFVVIEEDEFLRTRKPTQNFIEFLLSAPKGDELELPERRADMRKVDLC